MASFAGDPRSPTAGTQVTEYNVDEDAELERIRMSIADMETTGEYTGLPAGDMKEKQQIKTIPKLVGALEKRMPSQAQWNSKAEKLYDAFANSAQSPSFDQFKAMVEELMPLTPSQTKDALSLLNQRSAVVSKLGMKSADASSHSSGRPSVKEQLASPTFGNFQPRTSPHRSVLGSGRSPPVSVINTTGGKPKHSHWQHSWEKKTPLKHGSKPTTSSGLARSNPLMTPHSKATKPTIRIPKPGSSTRNAKPVPDSVYGMSLTDLMSPHRDKEAKGVSAAISASLRGHMKRRALTVPTLFSLWDKNRDGRLSKRAVETGLFNLGIETTTEEINEYFSAMDKAGKGRVDIETFTAFLQYKPRFGTPTYSPSLDRSTMVSSPSNRGQANVLSVVTKEETKRALSSCGSNSEAGNEDVVDDQSLLQREEARVKSIFRRLSMTQTDSSKEWLHSKREDRVLASGGRDHSGADDANPHAILKKIRNAMKRRTLQTSQLFRYCDADRGGTISKMELADGIRYLGIELTAHQLKTLWKAMDIDGDGSIDYTEFKLALDVARHNGPTMALINHGHADESIREPRAVSCIYPDRLAKCRQKLRAAAYVLDGSDLEQLFHNLDVHRVGKLPKARVEEVIKSHFPLKVEELTAVYKLIDPLNKGEVGYAEFEEFVMGEGGVDEKGAILKVDTPFVKKEKNLGELLLEMQRQQQRTILLNPPLFSGVRVNEVSERGAKELVLQLRLLGFDVNISEALLLLEAFGVSRDSFKRLHAILVAKKIIAASYVSNLDVLIRKFAKYDVAKLEASGVMVVAEGDEDEDGAAADENASRTPLPPCHGLISVADFGTVIDSIIDLNQVERKMLLRILDYDKSGLIPYREIFDYSRDDIERSSPLKLGDQSHMMIPLQPRRRNNTSTLTARLMKLRHLVSRSDAAGGILNLDFLRKMDRNMDGLLTREELYRGLHHEALLDQVEMDVEQVEEMLECFGARNSGFVKIAKLKTFERLDQVRFKLKAATYSQVGQDITVLFNIISRGEETIDLDIFCETLSRMCRLSGPELGMLLREVDVDDSGAIDKQGFAEFLRDLRVF
jgi:Ca2+-binding EF-hand superfamily protein